MPKKTKKPNTPSKSKNKNPPAPGSLTHVAIPIPLRDAMIKELGTLPHHRVDEVIQILTVAPKIHR